MKTHTIPPFFLRSSVFYAGIFFVGILLSYALIGVDPIINRDAYVYFKSARLFLESGAVAAFNAYTWSFYAVIAALLSQLGIAIDQAFFLLNTLLFAVLGMVFVRLYDVVIQPKVRVHLCWVALLFLAAADVNDYRNFIIRDVGFWCLSLSALLAFVRFIQTQQRRYALYWQVAIIVAFLFRSEALIWIVALPFSVFCLPHRTCKQSMQAFIALTMVFAALFVMGIIVLVLQDDGYHLLMKVPSIGAFLQVFQSFFHRVDVLADTVLNRYSQEYAALILWIGLWGLLLFKLLSGIGIVYLLFAFVARLRSDAIQCSAEVRLVLYAGILSLLPLMFFVLSRQFMIGRYTTLCVLIAILLLSFYIVPWLHQCWQKKPVYRFGIILVFVVMFLDAFVSTSASKAHMKTAGVWIASQYDKDVSMIMADVRYKIYSDRVLDDRVCIPEKVTRSSLNDLAAFRLIVWRVKDEDDAIYQMLTRAQRFQLVKTFYEAKRRERTVVFENTHVMKTTKLRCQ